MTDITDLPVAEGRGSVSDVPELPEGFTDTFTSRYVDAGEVRLHAVIGGEGPPLLLIHGWPETWYAWRMVMPALARDFEVVAVDQRGIGLSDISEDGYDLGTLAGDMAALMEVLGHHRFALYGTDTGMPIAYALAADQPERIDRLVVSEAFQSPGVHLKNTMRCAAEGEGTRVHEHVVVEAPRLLLGCPKSIAHVTAMSEHARPT